MFLYSAGTVAGKQELLHAYVWGYPETKKPVSAAIANTGSTFSLRFLRPFDLRSERFVFCSRNSPRRNNSPENNKKNRMQKDSSSGSSYLLFSSLKITAGFILSGCWSYHSAVGRICQQENSISWSFTLLCNKENSCYSKVTEFAMISTHRSIPSVPLFKQRS